MRRVTTLVIHHSAGSRGSAEEFRREHRAKGWRDIAYHGVICNGRGGGDGELQPGRPEEREGAGVYGNHRAQLEVCLVGNFEEGDRGYTGHPTPAQLRTLGEWLLAKAKATGARRVVGHREITLPNRGTACPGNQMPLDDIRAWFAANVDADQPVPLDVFLAGASPAPAANPLQLLRAIYGAKPPAAVMKALNEFATHPATQAWLKQWR